MEGRLRNMTAIYLFKGDRVLLLYRQGGRVVNNVWIGSAGGHFENYELNDAKACVLRELQEELSLTESDIHNLSLRYIALRRMNGEIRQNYYFFAELNEDIERDIKSNEGECKWMTLSELKELEMPYTAKYVIEHYLHTGINNDKLYAGIADGEKIVFIEMPMF